MTIRRSLSLSNGYGTKQPGDPPPHKAYHNPHPIPNLRPHLEGLGHALHVVVSKEPDPVEAEEVKQHLLLQGLEGARLGLEPPAQELARLPWAGWDNELRLLNGLLVPFQHATEPLEAGNRCRGYVRWGLLD